MTQINLSGDPVDAWPAEEEWPVKVKCDWVTHDGGPCRRYADIAVQFPDRDRPVGACSLHARGPWLHAAREK